MINVEMLSTGDEVLYGQITDTNAAWLAGYLFDHSFPMTRRNTVGDKFTDLVDVLKERSLVADILIVNGGLGPTSDDLSAEAAAAAAGVSLELHEPWLARMETFFAERGREMAPSNRKQAMIPAGSEFIDNPVGTACGFLVRLNRCLIFFTPGVPSEFKVMVQQQIVPRLQQAFPQVTAPLCLRMTTFGRSESDLAQQLDPLSMPEGVVLGYRSSMPIIELKLTGPASQEAAMRALWQTVRETVGQSLIYEGTVGLPAVLAASLQERNLSLVVSEQFTGGLLTWQLTSASVPVGNSEVLMPRRETLAALADRAAAFAREAGSDLALVIGDMADSLLNVALHTPDGTHALQVKWSASRHSEKIRQEVCAMLAMNMLRRWLNGLDVASEHGWISVVDALHRA